MTIAGYDVAADAADAPAAIDRVPPPDRVLRVAVPGGSVHVRVNGDLEGARPPLLLAHGGPGGCHASLVPALALAGTRAVVLYDQLDCGLSDRPGDPANWTVARFAAEMAAVRAALRLDRCHVLGHSWGATIALEHAASRPAGLCSLVLMGPLVSTAAWIADAGYLRARLPVAVQRTLAACEGPNPPPRATCDAAARAFYDRFWRLRDPLPAIAAYEAAIPDRFNAALYRAMWGPNEFRADGTLAAYDGSALLPAVGAPALFLIGDADEVTEATARRFAAMTPMGAVHVVPGAAHRIQNDRTDLFLATLDGWMRRHDGAAA